MKDFVSRFHSCILGVLNGFDRLVFRGYLESMSYVQGMQRYLWDRQVKLMDFTNWAQEVTKTVKRRFADQAVRLGHQVEYIRSPSIKKEELARGVQRDRGIRDGVIGSFSCVEPCRRWRIRGDRPTKHLVIGNDPGQCLHLYRYLDDRSFGFMHVRLQTWFPFSIQVCMNGREYLRRRLEHAKIGFEMRENCFADIANWTRAQALFDEMVDLDWIKILDGYAQAVFPDRQMLLGKVRYRWSVYQSEWASDLAFQSQEALDAIYPGLLRHAIISSDSATVLRYLGHPVTKAGQPLGHLGAEVTTRRVRRPEGICVKHHVGGNSVKLYNKQGTVLRTEMTMNDPKKYKVYRHKQGGRGRKDWRPLRASVVDLKRRSEIGQQVNDRYLDHQATANHDRSLEEVIAHLTRPVVRKGKRRTRPLDLSGRDRLLLDLLANPAFALDGIRNADLRQQLHATGRAAGKTDRQVSGMATRLLTLLRAHGVIKKVPRERRYRLTRSGLVAITSFKAALLASADQLTKLAA